jgi:hypothetical protein
MVLQGWAQYEPCSVLTMYERGLWCLARTSPGFAISLTKTVGVTSSKGWGLLSSMSAVKVLALLLFLLGLSFLDLRMDGSLWGKAGRKDGSFCFENSSHQKLTWREPVLQRGGSVQENPRET